MTNYTANLKTQIKTLRQERTDLVGKRIPQAEGEVAALEARVEKGRSRAQQHHPHKDPAALAELGPVRSALETLEARRGEIDRELARLQAQADAAQTMAILTARVQDIDGQIAAKREAVEADKAQVAKYELQRQAAIDAGNAAKDAAATALVSGGDPTMDDAQAHDRQADVLTRAIGLLGARIAEAEAVIASLRESREAVQGEIDVAEVHDGRAAMPGAWAALMPHLHRLLTAERRAYGYGAMSMPDLREEYRNWLDAQDAED